VHLRRRRPDIGRLVTTLRGGLADAVPLIELGIAPPLKEAVLGRPIASVVDDIAFMQMMGYDFVKIQPGITFRLNRHKAHIAAAPVYQNTPDRAWAGAGGPLIATWDDFEEYPWPHVEDITYKNFELAAANLPPEMGIIGQYGDIFTMTWELMGFEAFSMALVEDPELVAALMARVGDLIVGMFRVMARAPRVAALWYSDDIAFTGGLMVSPTWLRGHFFPHLARIGAFAREANIPLLYHSDGVLHTVLEDIIGAGVSALHPIEPLAMDIVELKDKVGDRLCLCGNIDVDLLTRGTPEQVAALVRKRLGQLGSRGGYAIGSSNSVPDYVPLANYLAMVETSLEYGIVD
jgi:uroporphyrinogen decarboxylase